MKRIVYCLAFLLISATVPAQRSLPPISIIPEPVSLVEKPGSFVLPENIQIQAPDRADLKYALRDLSDHLSVPTGYQVHISSHNPAAVIRLVLNTSPETVLGKEGYELTVSPGAVILKANEPAGLFYGIQSLLQLLPPEIESKSIRKGISWKAPAVHITDYPRFGWRGLMLDVSRHFYTKAEVEAYIDQMAKYKFNVFHWHLTDDEGWRIQIKSLPKLTEVGAWNVKKVGYFGRFSPPDSTEPRNYGGFYTQDDIRAVVQYARERFVNILPEIDVPGHSLAAVVSYPDLSCTPGAENYHVNSGEHLVYRTDSGTYAREDNTLCPANENVYVFLDKVFTEVANLFPFDYIHVGGDECSKYFWEKSDAIKNLMQQQGLKTQEEVQSYFEKRVEKIIESKGKKVIGWDEILEGGLAPDAAVMSWRGEQGGIAATALKHDVVMSPTTYAYLDYMQADPIIEPHIYASLHLSKAYQFDPIPEGADSAYIKGGQANLWTEQVYNMRQVEYMTWPRALAIAECVWTPLQNKNWDDFVSRVETQFKRFDIEEVKYDPAMYDPIFTAARDSSGQLQVTLSTEIKGLDIYYSFDNSFPDRFYPKYTTPLVPPKDAVMLKVITYRGDKPVGRMLSMPISELQSRADKKDGNYP